MHEQILSSSPYELWNKFLWIIIKKIGIQQIFGVTFLKLQTCVILNFNASFKKPEFNYKTKVKQFNARVNTDYFCPICCCVWLVTGSNIGFFTDVNGHLLTNIDFLATNSIENMYFIQRCLHNTCIKLTKWEHGI